MIKRIDDRFKRENRIDDSLATLERRYIGYVNDTLPIIDELAKESAVMRINGNNEFGVVFQNILDRIKYLL
jgi:adenylate kinase family enzyme